MAENSKIEWTDATWNIITGCDMVDAGCTNCYAMQLAGSRLRNHPSRAGLTRVTGGRAKWTGEVRFNDQWLDQPLRWSRPRRIFVCAHGDLFHPSVPDEWIDRVFAVMALCPQHTFQVLTKRPERARHHLQKLTDDGAADRLSAEAGAWFGDEADVFVANWINGWSCPVGTPSDKNPCNGSVRRWPLPNVWIGTSIHDQVSADKRIPELLSCPAAVRFVSAEPLLGPVDLTLDGLSCAPCPYCADGFHDPETGLVDCPRCDGTAKGDEIAIDLVIVGGESGPHARPMHPDWARSLRDQCVEAGVAFHFKQWGEWVSIYDRDRDDPDWRKCPQCGDWDKKRWLNLAGGQGFHGEKLNMMRRVGKRAAGRLLDGRTWDQMPGVQHG